VWICQILQEISQKRTRERMSDQEAKEIKAEAREIMPQPSTEREEMEGQDDREKKDREDRGELKLGAPFLNVQMMSDHNSSDLVFIQMTSDHNHSELGIHVHSNEPSSSKLVPKVVPLVVKTTTS
ncbi:hypothetical protein Tco_0566651, partial [Tanacetum coccineum]